MKMLWCNILSIIFIKKTALSGISQLVVDGNKIADQEEIASSLNKYFVSVIKCHNHTSQNSQRKC